MANTLTKPLLILLFAATAGFAATTATAAEDPGIHQVYQAAESGHLDQARNMMSQVLKDHPDSAKAHYVASEIDARSGDLASARAEFQTAEKLAPGLPFAKPNAVQELRNQLYAQQVQPPRVATPVNAIAPIHAQSGHSGGFPWGTAIGIGLAVWIAWLFFRRRYQPAAPVNGGYNNGGAPGGYGMGGGYPPAGGGPGLLGSLGTGLAVGAGVVAGEEIAHRLLDGNGERVIERDQTAYREDPSTQNPNMGGNDFGVGDSGSWDSGGDSGGIGGGDDSWS